MTKNKELLPAKHWAYPYETDILIATIPLIVMATYMYGVRVLAMQLVAVGTATLCDRLAAFLGKKPYDKSECGSLSSAVVFTLLLPASARYYVVVFGVAFMVLVGKHAFGGYENEPFNPAALAFAVVAVSWPKEVFMYPVPHTPLSVFSTAGVTLVEGPAALLRMNGLPQVGFLQMLLGNYAGPMGATFNLVLVACFMFLAARRRHRPLISVSFLATCALIALAFPRVSGVARWQVVAFEIFSGALIFAAVFIAPEQATSPNGHLAQVVYGVLVGVLTMLCRYYGVYELGVCFAVILANSFVPYIEKAATAFLERGKLTPEEKAAQRAARAAKYSVKPSEKAPAKQTPAKGKGPAARASAPGKTPKSRATNEGGPAPAAKGARAPVGENAAELKEKPKAKMAGEKPEKAADKHENMPVAEGAANLSTKKRAEKPTANAPQKEEEKPTAKPAKEGEVESHGI
ncbi:RnfABCDGE type electron transport complex subunit D [Ruminococcaceae bacterium OttesenSCG-928-N02]|nr:RnfABCDGE type electron transport complex subunit D [Ruminococcaceae bacterium OttesenSCG-928-N02]